MHGLLALRDGAAAAVTRKEEEGRFKWIVTLDWIAFVQRGKHDTKSTMHNHLIKGNLSILVKAAVMFKFI